MAELTVILRRFMSTSLGLSYLNELKYVEQSMEEWYIVSFSLAFTPRTVPLAKALSALQERNEQYVVQVETHVARLLNVDGARPEEDSLRSVVVISLSSSASSDLTAGRRYRAMYLPTFTANSSKRRRAAKF